LGADDRSQWKGAAMERLIERCAALDIDKDSLMASVRVSRPGGGRDQQRQSFRTTTAGLLALRDWLEGFGVTVVGMESTGVYWRAVY
jgi:transposase